MIIIFIVSYLSKTITLFMLIVEDQLRNVDHCNNTAIPAQIKQATKFHTCLEKMITKFNENHWALIIQVFSGTFKEISTKYKV